MIKTTVFCDKCRVPIFNSMDGRTFLGNVCCAPVNDKTKEYDHTIAGGFIGNCIDEDDRIYRHFTFCNPCVITILKL